MSFQKSFILLLPGRLSAIPTQNAFKNFLTWGFGGVTTEIRFKFHIHIHKSMRLRIIRGRVSLRLSSWRTCPCHCWGSGHCCGTVSIPGSGTSTYCGYSTPPPPPEKKELPGKIFTLFLPPKLKPNEVCSLSHSMESSFLICFLRLIPFLRLCFLWLGTGHCL